MIKSENFQEGVSGFRMKADGELEANNGKFRGYIEATSGFIQDVTIKNLTIDESGIFKGSLETPPLYISVIPETYTYHPTQSLKFLIDDLRSKGFVSTGAGTVQFVLRGTYDGRPIKAIAVWMTDATTYWADIVHTDGSITKRVMTVGAYPNGTLIVTTGRVLRLMDLPDGPIQPGVVYRDPNGFLKVT